MSEPIAPQFVGASTDAAGAGTPSSSGVAVAAEAAGAHRSAGQLLRQARQAQGLHIAALAAAIKVTPQKLEALENERFDLLPDPTFARALALAVCRYLKIDAEPVMSRLPLPREHRLEHINRGLATPFRDHSSRDEPTEWSHLLRPALLAPMLVLVAALVIYFVPVAMWKLPSFGDSDASRMASTNAPTTTSDATPVATEEPSPAGSVVSEPVQSSPAEPSTLSAAPPVAAAAPVGVGAAPLTIKATRESWVEVVDGQGRTLVSRSMPAGETVDLDGPAPLKLRIGNAVGTQVTFRGQTVSLASSTKDNVARLELK